MPTDISNELAEAIAALERLKPVWRLGGSFGAITSATQTDDGVVQAELSHGHSGEDDWSHAYASVNIKLCVGAVLDRHGAPVGWQRGVILFSKQYQETTHSADHTRMIPCREYLYVRDYVQNCQAVTDAVLEMKRGGSGDEALKRKFFTKNRNV